MDEELQNRCLVLTVDEDRGADAGIHRMQRERRTLEGLLARQEREQRPRRCTATRSGCCARCRS